MARKLLVADLLCGAGGSSTGCARALAELGLQMELVCVNHWPVAIDTHTRNHPEARHYCQDISTVRPHIIVPEGYLDLLMASPTCTHHSVARGGKPTSDQQRSDPWHIITWLTELRVKRMIIENVWEFCGWGPVDPRTGKPIKSRKSEYFKAWIETIRRLGYEPEWRKLNAADFGDATTRQRFILMARNDSRSISWPIPTHCRKTGDELALFPGVKPWRPARDIIDWSIKGRSIFGRKKPLAPKTLARIYAGAVKFNWPEPFLVILRNHMAGQSVDGPLPTIAANGTHIGLAQPIILNRHSAPRGETRPVTEPIPTPTTSGGGYLVEPFIVSAAHGNDADERDPNSRRCKSLDEPIGTIHAGGGNFAVAEPFIMSRHAEGAPRSVDEPTPTQVAKQSHLLISPYYGSGSGETCTSGSEPLPTVTSKGRFGMVVPITHADGSNRARDVDTDPLPTLTTANRGELAFITAQHGERPGQAPRVHDIDQPAPTIAARGHVDLVEATAEYDILFRMLEPHELAAAMGFTGDDAAYEFAGTKTEQIKQIGNAVSVAKMKACVKAIMADAAAGRKAKRAAIDDEPEAISA
jgi:DNA (cytosine-5)-methyltransferase 1